MLLFHVDGLVASCISDVWWRQGHQGRGRAEREVTIVGNSVNHLEAAYQAAGSSQEGQNFEQGSYETPLKMFQITVKFFANFISR